MLVRTSVICIDLQSFPDPKHFVPLKFHKISPPGGNTKKTSILRKNCGRTEAISEVLNLVQICPDKRDKVVDLKQTIQLKTVKKSLYLESSPRQICSAQKLLILRDVEGVNRCRLLSSGQLLEKDVDGVSLWRETENRGKLSWGIL
jgi:hypothetical protein